jgi:phosphoserine aminotransferase
MLSFTTILGIFGISAQKVAAMVNPPAMRPRVPHFSSGPCPKHPGWKIENLKDSSVGRSHRSRPGKAKLKSVIDLTRELLEVPAGYRVGIVPASDTGAVEMALWSLLGPRGVDVLSWESFGEGWVTDVTKQLKLKDVRVLRAPYGELPDLGEVDFSRDVVFAWNGTTSGVRVPNDDWIKEHRSGLTICDATSAAFAQALPMHKLDVVTFSWQKVLGGEGAHGMLILSPRAVERLQSYTPPWPLPKIFRMTNGSKLNEAIFEGETINTPSMICVEDCLDALQWAKSIGGLPVMMQRADKNLAAIEAWVEKTTWAQFLARSKKARSNTSVCITVADPAITELSIEARRNFIKAMADALEGEDAAYDIAGLVLDAPPHLRIWAGSTVDIGDLEALFPWLDWAFAAAKAALAKAA